MKRIVLPLKEVETITPFEVGTDLAAAKIVAYIQHETTKVYFLTVREVLKSGTIRPVYAKLYGFHGLEDGFTSCKKLRFPASNSFDSIVRAAEHNSEVSVYVFSSTKELILWAQQQLEK